MRKEVIITAAIAACLALCAVVWPQTETVKETPVPTSTPVVTAPEPIVAEVKLETEIDLPPEPAPEPIPALAQVQAVTGPQSGDMVYVEGFGWLEYQGPNHCEYGADIYENGNKIGVMG